jgi:type I restriction enzyme S subunit
MAWMRADWPARTVQQLQDDGILLVEDGNHGEYRPRPDEFSEVGTCFIRAADMDAGRVLFSTASRINDTALKRIRKGIGKPGDILLSHKGTVGKLAVAPHDCEPFVCSPQTTFWRVLDEEKLDRRFLYFFMNSRSFREQLAAIKGETDMADYASLTAQRRFEVPTIDLALQKQIGSVLGSLDDKIELNRRMNETLEGIAQAIFRDWFVDYGPTRRKLAGITERIKIMGGLVQDAARAAELAALFPDALGDNGLPVGWRLEPLSSLAIQSTQTVSPAAYPSVLFSHYSLPAFDAGQTPKLEHGASILSNKILVPDDAVLLSKLNPEIERVWLIPPRSGEQKVCSTEFLAFTASPTSARSYLFCLFRESEFRDFLKGMVTGTSKSHQRVSPKSLVQCAVTSPPKILVGAFDEMVQPMLAKALMNRNEQRALAATRDLLLPKLMSGEIRLRDAAAIAKEAAE